MNLCELNIEPDTVPRDLRKCVHIGFMPKTGVDICCLYDEPLGIDNEGYITICSSCTKPHTIRQHQG